MKTYEKIIFTPGQLLKAAHLNHMEEGISEIEALAIVNEKKDDPVVITDNLGENFKSIISHIEPLQSGSGDPSPDNIRPISGWDKVVLTKCGKNLLNPDEYAASTVVGGLTVTRDGGVVTLNGTTTLTETSIADYSLFPYRTTLPPGTYALSGSPAGGGSYTYNIFTYIKRADGTNAYISDTGKGATFTISDGDVVQLITIRIGGQIGTVNNLTFTPQLEYAAATTGYEPYQGETYTAQFPETVYGGEYDLETGELKVTHTGYVVTGEEGWKVSEYQTISGVTRYDATIYSIGLPKTNLCICSHYKGTGLTSQPGAWVAEAWRETAGLRIAHSYNSVEELTAYLKAQYAAGTPVTYAYELLEPYTMQLAPQEIKILKGTNMLYSDCGETTVIYTADTKMYIDNKFLELQNAIVSLGGNV